MRRYLATVREKAERMHVTCECLQVEHDRPDEAILHTVKARNCDLIVMASHGRRGTSAKLLGSVTTSVLLRSIVPVLVYHASLDATAEGAVAPRLELPPEPSTKP